MNITPWTIYWITRLDGLRDTFIVVVPRLAQNESLEQLGSGVVTLAKDWLEELRPKKKAE